MRSSRLGPGGANAQHVSLAPSTQGPRADSLRSFESYHKMVVRVYKAACHSITTKICTSFYPSHTLITLSLDLIPQVEHNDRNF